MLGPIGSNLLSALKVMTPSEVERVTRSARSELIEKPKALEEDAVSFDEHDEANVIKLKSKKGHDADKEREEKKKKETKEEIKKVAISNEHQLSSVQSLDDSVIFIEEWAKSKDSKKKLQGKDGMKVYSKMASYEPIKVNAEDEDDIIISTGTSGILVNKKQS